MEKIRVLINLLTTKVDKIMEEDCNPVVYGEKEDKKYPWYIRIFPDKKEKGLTATKANLMARFGVDSDFKTIVDKKIKEVDGLIKSKLQFSSQERLLALTVPKDQTDLFERVREYYNEKGFITFYVGKDRVPELGESNYLFISWDLKINKGEK